MKQIIWTCDGCGIQKETEGDWIPEGWVNVIKINKIFHDDDCLLSNSDMTSEEKKKYEEAIWMA